MGLPDNAKRVFKGVIFDIYHWNQEMLDGSFQVFEGIKRGPTVNVISVKNNKIVLSREEQPFVGKFIDVQGGIGEDGEKPVEIAKRELLEEAGFECEDIIEFYGAENLFSKKIIWPMYIFIAKNCRKVQEQQLDKGGENIELFEVTFDEFLEIVEDKEFRNKILRDMLFRMKHTPGEIEEFKELLFG